MDMKLSNSGSDECACDEKDVTKMPWTVSVDERPSGNVAETDEQGDVTKMPWTAPVKG